MSLIPTNGEAYKAKRDVVSLILTNGETYKAIRDVAGLTLTNGETYKAKRDVVSLIPTNGEMYKIQPYVIACHCLTECKWFSPDIPFSSTNMIDLHDITEKLLKEAFNTINNNHNFQLKMYKP